MHIMESVRQSYPDGSAYSGPLRQTDGLRHGSPASLTLDNSFTYAGQFENGMFQGLGVVTRANGDRFEGQFVKGRYHGLGVFTKADGLTYQGEFFEGQVWGKGRIVFPDGSSGQPRHEGYFEKMVLKKREQCENVVEKLQGQQATLDRKRNKDENIEL